MAVVCNINLTALGEGEWSGVEVSKLNYSVFLNRLVMRMCIYSALPSF